MQTAIKISFFLFLIVLLIVVSATAFIGAGYIIHLAIPLTLFQSCLLCIGATMASTFIIFGIAVGMVITPGYKNEYYDEDEDWDDEDEDGDEDYDTPRRRFDKKLTVIKTDKIGRNVPCPCGSGKKYKLCCGR